MRRQRRIPPRGDRAELAAAREIETSECANGNNGGIAWAKARNALQDSRLTRSIKNATDRTVSLNRRVFQRYPPIADIGLGRSKDDGISFSPYEGPPRTSASSGVNHLSLRNRGTRCLGRQTFCGRFPAFRP